MDSSTAFVANSLMMLANGGVLGLILHGLPAALRPAAMRWQVGVLAMAGGGAVYAFPSQLPMVVLVTLANALLLLGLTLHLRALQHFFGLPRPRWQLLPGVVGTLGVFWFAAFQPDTSTRIVVISAAWSVLMGLSISILRIRDRTEASRGRQMLRALNLVVLSFMLLRAGYFLAIGIPANFSISGSGSWMNLLTPMFASVLPVIGTTAFLLMCSEHIRRQWENAASTDYLTGLANRRTLTEQGRQAFEAARAQGRQVALALFDIDDFKSINDRFGHEVGDLALKHVAAILAAEISAPQTLARTGGEEFVALLGEADGPQAHRAAEQLRLAVQRHPFLLRGLRIPLTVSVGIAASQAGDGDFASLLRRADQAMYAAKSLGRNRVELAA